MSLAQPNCFGDYTSYCHCGGSGCGNRSSKGIKGEAWSPAVAALLATATTLAFTACVMHVPLFLSGSPNFAAFRNSLSWVTVDSPDTKVFFGLTRYTLESTDQDLDGSLNDYGIDSEECILLQNNNTDFDFKEDMCDNCEDAGVEATGLFAAAFVLICFATLLSCHRFHPELRITPETQIIPAIFAFVAGIFDLVAALGFEGHCFRQLPNKAVEYGPAFYLTVVLVVIEWLCALIHLEISAADEYKPRRVETAVEPRGSTSMALAVRSPPQSTQAQTTAQAAAPPLAIEASPTARSPKATYREETISSRGGVVNLYPQSVTLLGGPGQSPQRTVYASSSFAQQPVVPSTTVHQHELRYIDPDDGYGHGGMQPNASFAGI